MQGEAPQSTNKDTKDYDNEEKKRGEEKEEEKDDDQGGADGGGIDSLLASDLSAFAMAALQEHLALKAKKEMEVGETSEDFGLSQFWFTEKTSKAVADECLSFSTSSPVAILSAPSIFYVLTPEEMPRFALMEFDERFGIAYPDQFIRYDFNSPTVVAERLRGVCDVLVLDPPYLVM